MSWTVILSFMFLRVMPTYGNSNGPPTVACVSMFPSGHGVNAQSSPAPYTITTSTDTYQRGQNITVTIQAQGSPFKGFFIQARSSGSSNPVGRFYKGGTDSEVQLMTCSGGKHGDNAVSHSSRADKTVKQFIWNNPDGGDVTFKATFVKVKTSFWTNVQSALLSEKQTTTKQETSTKSQVETTKSQAETTKSQAETTKSQADTTESQADTTSGEDVTEIGDGTTLGQADTTRGQAGTTSGEDVTDSDGGTTKSQEVTTGGRDTTGQDGTTNGQSPTTKGVGTNAASVKALSGWAFMVLVCSIHVNL